MKTKLRTAANNGTKITMKDDDAVVEPQKQKHSSSSNVVNTSTEQKMTNTEVKSRSLRVAPTLGDEQPEPKRRKSTGSASNRSVDVDIDPPNVSGF